MDILITESLCLKEYRTKRVAAYARVSSKKQEQLHSLEAQIEYYERALDRNPDYKFVGIYADRGISGATDNRPEFQRLLADCRAGVIDAVITKSITRFARNTEVFLASVRELSSLGIDVYFEKENIHSLARSELELAFFAQYAEEEIRSMSGNQKLKVRANFAKGIPNTGRMIGYRLERGVLVKQEQEAEIVKLIFQSYLDGMGTPAIADLLNDKGYTTINGRPWGNTTVRKVLRNEKYAGNMLLQKTYCKGHRSAYSSINHGELRMYEVEESHEPIISQEMYDSVQAEILRRAEVSNESMKEIAQGEHLFNGFLICGNCGCRYLYCENTYRKNGSPYPKWYCGKSKSKGQKVCSAKGVPENILIQQTEIVLEKAQLIKTEEASFIEQLPVYLGKYVDHITVTGDRELTYYLKDGTVHIAQWEYDRRSKSWTPEMKQKARERQKMLIAQRKEAKNAQS